jgi:acid phosphatase family membrane protein YuiD
MILSDHKPLEIYSGIIIGILCQLIAFAFIG